MVIASRMTSCNKQDILSVRFITLYECTTEVKDPNVIVFVCRQFRQNCNSVQQCFAIREMIIMPFVDTCKWPEQKNVRRQGRLSCSCRRRSFAPFKRVSWTRKWWMDATNLARPARSTAGFNKLIQSYRRKKGVYRSGINTSIKNSYLKKRSFFGHYKIR